LSNLCSVCRIFPDDVESLSNIGRKENNSRANKCPWVSMWGLHKEINWSTNIIYEIVHFCFARLMPTSIQLCLGPLMHTQQVCNFLATIVRLRVKLIWTVILPFIKPTIGSDMGTIRTMIRAEVWKEPMRAWICCCTLDAILLCTLTNEHFPDISLYGCWGALI